MKNLSIPGISSALIAMILWGTAGTAQSFAKNISPFWIGALRLMLACLIFHSICYFFKRTTAASNASTTTPQPIPYNKTYWKSIAISGLSIGLFNLAFFTGVNLTGIAIGTITIIGSSPIWAGLLQAVIMRQPPSRLWWAGTFCAIMGGVWMIMMQASSWQINYMGLTICLSGGFCYALYTITSKRLVSTNSPLYVTTHTFSVAALVAVSTAFITTGLPTITLGNLGIIVYLAVFTTCIAYLLYTNALKTISAPTGVALTLLEPVTAFVLAIFVVKEPINMLAIIGLCLILIGLALVLRSEMQKT
jgi:Predicted permease, DMT superfamily